MVKKINPRMVLGILVLVIVPIFFSYATNSFAISTVRIKLMRYTSSPRVYYITEKGFKRWIPNEQIFLSYGNRWKDVITVSQGQLDSVPDNFLVKLPTGVRVYKLENGTKRWITSSDAFNLNGFKWDQIAPVNTTELNYYPTGSDINFTVLIPTPSLNLTPTLSPSSTPYPTPTLSMPPTPTVTPTATPTPTPSSIPTPSLVPSLAPAPSPIPSPTPIVTPTATPSPIPTPSLTSAGMFNVLDFGADNTCGKDSTKAIQSAIDAAKTFSASPRVGLVGPGATVLFPPGKYCVSLLNGTRIIGLTFKASSSSVNIYGNKQTVATPIIDFTGSAGVVVDGINVAGQNPDGTDSAVIPSTGFLVADSAPGGQSDKNYFVNCGATGKFTSAALYVFSSTDNGWYNCVFQNSNPSGYALFAGSINAFNISSLFTTIYSGATPVTGDNSFFQNEFHGVRSATGTAHSIWLHSVFATRFYGGKVDNSGPGHVRFDGVNQSTSFSGTQFYSESGHAPKDVFFTNGGSSVDGLTVLSSNFLNNGFSNNFFNGVSFINTYTCINFGGPAGCLMNGISVAVPSDSKIVPSITSFAPLATTGIFNILDFGADNTCGKDSTKAIQSAIDAAKTRSGTTVLFPPGIYCISSLNVTGVSGLTLKGSSPANFIYGNLQTVSAPIIDLTGSSGIVIDGLNVLGMDPGGNRPPVTPSTGFLVADSAQGGRSHNNYFINSGALGYFANATVYVFGSTDNQFYNSAFQSWDPNAYALFAGSTNTFNISSPFTQIFSGTPITRDNSFFQNEFHGVKSLAGVANAYSIWLHGVSGMRFYGGNIDNSGPGQVRFDGANQLISFFGTLFYSESGHAPKDVFFTNGGSSVDGLTLIGGDFNHNGFSDNFLHGSGFIKTYTCINSGGPPGCLIN